MQTPDAHNGAGALVALAAATTATVELRNMTAFSGPGVAVDHDAGTIHNVSAMTSGEALGHGFEIDDTLLSQCADAINQAGGVRMRLGHPPLLPDGTGGFIRGDAVGQTVGTFANARVEKGQLRGDVQLGDYAEHMPGGGNAKKYLTGIADQHPHQIGLSVVFQAAPYVGRKDGNGNRLPPLGRAKGVEAVDFVDKPAANKAGLLSTPPTPNTHPGASPGIVPNVSPKGVHMDPKLKQHLVTLGLDPNATDGEAKAFLSALGRRKQTTIVSLGLAAAYEAVLGRKPQPEETPQTPTATPTPTPAPTALSGGAAPAAAGDPGAVMLAEVKIRNTFLGALANTYKLGDAWVQEQTVGLSETAIADFYEAARKSALKALAAKNKPLRIEVGEDNNLTSLGAAVEDAVELRMGRKPNVDLYKFDGEGHIELSADRKPVARAAHGRANQFRGMSLPEMARAFLGALGVDTVGLSRQQVAALVFNRGAIAQRTGDVALSLGVGDFPGLLANVMNKGLRTAYMVTPVTWDQWARRDTNPDFKPAYRLQLSETDITSVAAGAEYPEASLVDSKETYTLGKFGRIISFNWETLVNDDLNAFSQIPRKMGNACRRAEDFAAYNVLQNNQVMTETGLALFNASTPGHGNLGSGAITIANLDAGVQAVAAQRDIGSKDTLAINPQIMIVSQAKQITAKQLIGSPVDPTKNNNTPNPFQGSFKVVATPRITGAPWYLAADPDTYDTVVVAFLEGEDGPVFEQEDGFSSDKRRYKVRHVFTARALDYRGLYKSTGV